MAVIFIPEVWSQTPSLSMKFKCMHLKQVNCKEYPPEYPPVGGGQVRCATPLLMHAHMHCSHCTSKGAFKLVDRKRLPAGAMSALAGGSLSYLTQGAG